MTIHIEAAVREAMLNVLADAVDAGSGPGTIEVRSGTQPANANTTATGTLLATFTCEDPAFGAAAAPTVDLDAAPDLTTTAAATGTATWARVKDSAGVTVLDGSVTSVAVGTGDFLILSTSIVSGQTVNLTAGSLTLAA